MSRCWISCSCRRGERSRGRRRQRTCPQSRNSRYRKYVQSLIPSDIQSWERSTYQRDSTGNSGLPIGSITTSTTVHNVMMERTPSGNTIIVDSKSSAREDAFTLLRGEDVRAAHDALASFEFDVSSPRSYQLRLMLETCDILEDDTLRRIFMCADDLFFKGALQGKVQWEWSCDEKYHHWLMGTTALRPRRDGGVECLVVLSEPLLRNNGSDNPRIIRVFLHELVHCYLFIRCGIAARAEGGHTKGFHMMEGAIHQWLENISTHISSTFETPRGAQERALMRYDLCQDPAFPVFDRERIFYYWHDHDTADDLHFHFPLRSDAVPLNGGKSLLRVYDRNSFEMANHDSYHECSPTGTKQHTFYHSEVSRLM